MTTLKPFLLALVLTESMAGGGLAGHDVPPPAAAPPLFQATNWLSPLGFSPTPDSLASPVGDAAGTPAFLQLFAPKGGRLSTSLQIPADYKIKKILLCSDQARPLAGVKVQLMKDGPAGDAVQLPFQQMSGVAPGCAVYALSTGIDDWGRAGGALDAGLYSKLEILLPSSKTRLEIEAVGIRLQAAAPHPASNPRGGWPIDGKAPRAPSARDDVANVYFTQSSAYLGRALYDDRLK